MREKNKQRNLWRARKHPHRRRHYGGDGSDRPHGQKVVGAMLQVAPRNFVMTPLYTAKGYSKKYECVIMKLRKVI